MEDQVRLFDEQEVAGIEEVVAPIAKFPTIAEMGQPIVLPKPKEVFYKGSKVWASETAFYIMVDGSSHPISQFSYDPNRYTSNRKDLVEAVCLEYGINLIPVFCRNAEDAAQFKKLEETISISLRGNFKAIAFFTGKYTHNSHSLDEGVATITFDGSIVTYDGYNEGAGFIGLETPVAIPPDDLFKDIMRFLSRSVKGVRSLLLLEKQKLEDVKCERSEDMFTYLQEVTPTPEKANIHEELLAILEKKYSEDALVIQDRLQKIDQYDFQIKSAKSQMPSGKKGKALREGYLKHQSLGDLLDWFDLRRAGNTMTLVFWFRQDLVLEADSESDDDEEKTVEIHYGRPTVTVHMSTVKENCRDRTYIQRVSAVSQDYRAFVHPHLDGQRSWCLGTYIVPLSNAIVGGNIPMAASLLWQYLNNYNASSPLVQLEACKENMDAARHRDLIVRRR